MFARKPLGVVLAIGLCGLEVGAQPWELQLKVDPSDSVLVLEGRSIQATNSSYPLSKRPETITGPLLLRAPGFADLTLPSLDPKELKGQSFVLKANSMQGYQRRFPWILPTFLALAASGGVVLWRTTRPPQEITSKELPPEPKLPLASSSNPASLVGTPMGDYHIQELLGSGGMAVVYKAIPIKNPGPQNAVAIKVIRPDQVSPEFRQRFEREIEVCMKLAHPNVMRILDWSVDKEVAYLVMEFVDGLPLNRCIPPGGVSLTLARKLLSGIIDGLAYAHSKGIVHRDLKPENVMVARDGGLQIMDFGLARDREVRTLTVHGSAVGTPDYMAPEQIAAAPGRATLNDKSDQYALGILIFEVLTGRRPFEWDDDPIKLVKIITMQLTQAPPALSSVRPEIPKEVEDIVNKMLSKDPEERYPSVREAGDELLKVLPTGESLEPIQEQGVQSDDDPETSVWSPYPRGNPKATSPGED